MKRPERSALDPALRERFDRLLEEVLDELPDDVLDLLEECPLVVDDEPSERTLRQMRIGDRDYLCGLYTGIPLTDRSVEHSGVLPDRVQVFRRGVVAAARARKGHLSDRRLKRQIRITVLHEIGHHFGLDEDDLRELGYE